MRCALDAADRTKVFDLSFRTQVSAETPDGFRRSSYGFPVPAQPAGGTGAAVTGWVARGIGVVNSRPIGNSSARRGGSMGWVRR